MTTTITTIRASRLSTARRVIGLAIACCTVCCLGLAAAARAQQVPPAEQAAPAASPAGLVNLNTASAEELERLPGIGPTRARAILALRAKLSRFSRLEDLLRVKGIGRATFRKLRPWLALSGPTTLQSSVRSARGSPAAGTQ